MARENPERERESSEETCNRRSYLKRSTLFAATGLGAGRLRGRTGADAQRPNAEVTTVSVNHQWEAVRFSSTYENPVVAALPPSYAGPEGSSTRLRNVTATGFEVAVEEWLTNDGPHRREEIGCLVVDEGVSRLADGTHVEAGTVRTDHGWSAVDFAHSFGTEPVVLSQVQTRNGWQPVVTRQRNVSTAGMELRLQEEEARGAHVPETVGYVAVEPGAGTLLGHPFEAGTLSNVGDDWRTVEFSGDHDRPVFLADLQTCRGGNTCSLRHRNLSGSSVEVFTEEETSEDAETAHVGEEIGYVVLDGNTDSATDGGGSADSPAEQRVVGYYGGWSRYDDYLPSDLPLEEVTHVIYAALDVEPNGEVTLYDEWGDPRNLAAFRDLKREHPDTKVLLSVGGWTLSEHFSDAALTAERRQRFARTSLELLREYDLDGIDVDWEYPDGGGMEANTVRPEDPRNFTLLLKTLRERLTEAERTDGTEYVVSAAVSANPRKIDPLEAERVGEHADFLNVMTYDYSGPWEDRTDFNAPLYAAPDDPAAESTKETFNTDYGMRYWAEQGVARSKLNVGLPFYARSFASVPDRNDGLFQRYEGTANGTWADPGVTGYANVADALLTDPGYEQHWHEEAKVPWLYSPEEGVFTTYENPRSARIKARYAESNGFGGVMFWRFYGDRNEELLDALRNVLSA